MERVVIKRKRKQQWQMLIIGPFAMYTMVNAMLNMDSKGILYYALLIFSSLVLLFFFNALRQMLNRKPALVIDESGLTDNISLANAKFIAWNNIRKCELKKYMRRDHLLIFMRDLSTLDLSRKKMMQIFERDLGTPVALPLDAMKVNKDELAKIVEIAIDQVNNEDDESEDAESGTTE